MQDLNWLTTLEELAFDFQKKVDKAKATSNYSTDKIKSFTKMSDQLWYAVNSVKILSLYGFWLTVEEQIKRLKVEDPNLSTFVITIRESFGGTDLPGYINLKIEDL